MEEMKLSLGKKGLERIVVIGSPVVIKVLAFIKRLEAGGEVGESWDTGHLMF